MLWWELRDHKLGVQFRRQMPIDPYTVDFACHKLRLVIEIDGRTHATPEAVDYDARRQRWIESHGWRVLRFPDDLVIGGLPLVVDKIKAECSAVAGTNETRVPSPRSGEGGISKK